MLNDNDRALFGIFLFLIGLGFLGISTPKSITAELIFKTQDINFSAKIEVK